MFLAVFPPIALMYFFYFENFFAGSTGATSPEDYSLFLSENGHLSFENPNYQVGFIIISMQCTLALKIYTMPVE